MNVRIESDTSFFTDIEVKNANGEAIFDGSLKREADLWVLYSEGGNIVQKWRGSGEHLAVLAKALAAIAKATGSAA